MWQKLIIVGNLGRDPEMRYTPGGKAVTNMSVATNRKYKDANGQSQEETTWFRVSVWGSQAEAVNQYLHQGSRVLVEGRLVPDPETGGPKIWKRNDGSSGANFEITAWRVVFLSYGDEAGTGGRSAARPGSQQAAAGQSQSYPEDDIPF